MLPFDAAQAKKQTFVGALDFTMDLAATSQQSTLFHLCGTKTFDIKRTLRVKWSHNIIIALGQNFLANE